MVAEKPSLALSIAQILSNGHLSSKKGFNNVCSIHEWTGRFQSNPSARFRMTSVAGHVFGLDFIPKYNNWDKVDPVSGSLTFSLHPSLHDRRDRPNFSTLRR